jgi:hypothetical protein
MAFPMVHAGDRGRRTRLHPYIDIIVVDGVQFRSLVREKTRV